MHSFPVLTSFSGPEEDERPCSLIINLHPFLPGLLDFILIRQCWLYSAAPLDDKGLSGANLAGKQLS